jgi:hypothetical protein
LPQDDRQVDRPRHVALKNTLGLERTANVLWNKNESFDFQIMSSPEELDAAVKDKLVAGNTARLAKVQPKADAASGSAR